MFQDVDATLRAMLDDDEAPEIVQAADVSFVTPDKDFKPAQDTVNLFLHDVQENRVLRDQDPLLERLPDDGFVSRLPPMRVDCAYVVTVWSHKTGAVKIEEEHLLLGELLGWLSRFSVIDERFLRGQLVRQPALFPVPASVGRPREGTGTSQFWTALGVAPRPALSFALTLALESPEPAERFPRVREVRVQPTAGHPRFRGRLLQDVGGTAQPASGARVEVLEAGRDMVVGGSGAFAFDRLDFGTYTLLVRLTGRPDTRTQVEYTSGREVHTVVLPPHADP
ncbi:Pvc16 family protein [Streptomyces massasporeus]|uniref:Pvc16 family protein n=1 Tax=Streptomyces massasporeus TaxID=67324 RepID=UPI00382558E2